MKKLTVIATAAASLVLAACATSPAPSPAPTGPMGFFITSVGSGKGADLGGIEGADAHCQRLATAAGAGARTWRAYLSVPGTMPSANSTGVPAIHARERIGSGPWFNAKGTLVAQNLDQLHNGNNVSKATGLDERGNVVPARGDKPNEHDMLTGTRSDGTAFAPQTDTTCRGWKYSGPDGAAVVGHHDLNGPTQDNWSKSWNFSHQTPGCSQEALVRVGGGGRFYCFAAN